MRKENVMELLRELHRDCIKKEIKFGKLGSSNLENYFEGKREGYSFALDLLMEID